MYCEYVYICMYICSLVTKVYHITKTTALLLYSRDSRLMGKQPIFQNVTIGGSSGIIQFVRSVWILTFLAVLLVAPGVEKMAFKPDEFMTKMGIDPSLEQLDVLKKTELIALGTHLELDVKASYRKDVLKDM